MVYCHQCGHQNPDSANFCARCGERLASLETESPGQATSQGSTDTTTSIPVVRDEAEALELDEEQRAAVANLPAGSALLVVQAGPGTGARYLLDSAEITVGRKPSCDVFLDDITVSRVHVVIRRGEGAFRVEDRKSLNGTYVNRQVVERTVELHPGDELQIGKFRMVYHPSPRGLS